MKRNATVFAYVVFAVALAVTVGHRLFLRNHLLMVDFLASLGGSENVEVFLNPDEAWLFSVDGWPPPPPPLGMFEEGRPSQIEQDKIGTLPSGWEINEPPIEITGRTRDLAKSLSRVEVTQSGLACFCASVPEFLIRSIKGDRVVDFWIGLESESIIVYSRSGGLLDSINSFSAPYSEVFDFNRRTNHFGNAQKALDVKIEIEKVFQQVRGGNA